MAARKQLTEWADFFRGSRQRDIHQLKAVLDGSTIPSETTRSTLTDLLEARLFEEFYGIYAESELREELAELHGERVKKRK